MCPIFIEIFSCETFNVSLDVLPMMVIALSNLGESKVMV
jgi:hypothetical protein